MGLTCPLYERVAGGKGGPTESLFTVKDPKSVGSAWKNRRKHIIGKTEEVRAEKACSGSQENRGPWGSFLEEGPREGKNTN